MSKFKKRKRKVVFYKNKRILLYSFLFLLLFISMGYSVLNTNLNILGDVTVKEYVAPTLYNVLKQAAKEGTYAKEYTGEHHDSFTEEPSQKIYHWYGSNDTNGTAILDKNNVIFANHCWQMIRTTDTGGVKMIYNGEVEDGKCLNTRGNHVGYAAMTTQSLSTTYYYGTDYTYDKTSNVFSLSGTTSTGEIKQGEYTCKSTTADGTCATLYLVDTLSSGTTYYVLPLNGNSHYSQFGTLQFNGNISSPAYVGYMYGGVYKQGHFGKIEGLGLASNASILQFDSLDTSFWYSDSILYDNSSGKYSLVNPYQLSNISDYSSLVGKYTFRNSSNTFSKTSVYYIAGVNDTKMYYQEIKDGNLLSSYEPIVFGDSILDNNNGTFTINNPISISLTDWFTGYENYKGKYLCGNNSLTCENPRFITTANATDYTFLNAEKKILIGKTRNDLVLQDTLLLRIDELLKNPNDYNEYKYTCGTTSSVCTKTNLHMIQSYYHSGYNYVNNYHFGSSIEWDGEQYMVRDTVGLEFYNDLNNISTHHYLCLTYGETTCSSVAYIYYVGSDWVYYILLKDGVTSVQQALDDMLKNNSTNSIIKSGIDAWYKHFLLDYSSMLEDSVFCNNRTLKNIGGWNDNGGVPSSYLQFKEYSITNDLSCPNETDRFSLLNDNAKLTYKVGLLTSSEMNIVNNSIVRKTGQAYWLSAPDVFTSDDAYVRTIKSDGTYSNGFTNNNRGVRPAISLTPGTRYSDGDGSMANPYVVETN